MSSGMKSVTINHTRCETLSRLPLWCSRKWDGDNRLTRERGNMWQKTREDRVQQPDSCQLNLLQFRQTTRARQFRSRGEMSSSELIGSHVYSPQQLSTAGQQCGTTLPCSRAHAVGCVGTATFGKKRKSAAVNHAQEVDVANVDERVRR